MKQKFQLLVLTCLFAAFLNYNAHAQPESLPSGVVIPNTQVLKFTSSFKDREYQLYINLPRNYQQDTGKSFPVVYLLDGQWDFALLSGIYGAQYYDGFLPELITVGITWGGKNPDYGSLRESDFTPTRTTDKPFSGGAPEFLACIKKEIIPFISSRYRVTGDRSLLGSSLGGLFTLYALFTEPALFQRYVLTSPSLWWDNHILTTYEKKYEQRGSRTPVRLFMAIGALEDNLPEFRQFDRRLKQGRVKGLELNTLVISHTGHSGAAVEGFSRGLQSVFEKPSLQLAPAILNRYAGVYLAGTDTVNLSVEKGKLIGRVPGNPKMVLHAATEKDFYVKGVFINVHFQTDDSGKVSGFRLGQFEGSVFVNKLR